MSSRDDEARRAAPLVPAPPPAGSAPAAPAPGLRRSHARLALAIAVGADLIQFVALPFFLPGALSPWDDVLDVAIGLVLVRLLGWHWVFLPAFVSELVPGLDLVPTWTMAVLIAARARRARDGH